MEASTRRYHDRAGDRPCGVCAVPVHPADADVTRKHHGTKGVLCLTCLRHLEQQFRERQREPTHLQRVAAAVRADPRLLLP